MGNASSTKKQEKIQNQIEELKESLEKEKQFYIIFEKHFVKRLIEFYLQYAHLLFFQ